MPDPVIPLHRPIIVGTAVEIRPGRVLDVAVHVGRQADAPVVFFCHGAGGNKDQWRIQWQTLANEGYSLVAWDLYGHGDSPEPERLRLVYPFELSGGQRQRVVIAMALAFDPSLLIADEPTSALDVTTQAQIIDLLRKIQQDKGMSLLFITHDFAVVEAIADRVLVLEKGQLVEQGSAHQVLRKPQAFYTQQLLAAVSAQPRAPRTTVDGSVVLKAEQLNKVFCSNSGWWRKRATQAWRRFS